MKNILLLTIALFAFVGCSNDNKVTIQNDAQMTIGFNFLAHSYTVAPGTSQTISDIPNGTYTFSVFTYIPSTATSWSITPNAGSCTFQTKNTAYLFQFGSTFVNYVYAVTYAYTSTLNTSSSTVTSN